MTKNELRNESYRLLDEKRIPHVAGCEEEAVRLAERYSADTEKAAVAGILHDITKRLSFDEQLEMCSQYDIVNDRDELKAPKLMHAKTGAALAREKFGIDDDIYSAIRYHTTGKPDMTLLEKIIYLADYIEPTRDFEGVEELRALAYDDIDKAMALGLKMSLEEITGKGQTPYKDTKDAYEYYKSIT